MYLMYILTFFYSNLTAHLLDKITDLMTLYVSDIRTNIRT